MLNQNINKSWQYKSFYPLCTIVGPELITDYGVTKWKKYQRLIHTIISAPRMGVGYSLHHELFIGVFEIFFGEFDFFEGDFFGLPLFFFFFFGDFSATFSSRFISIL